MIKNILLISFVLWQSFQLNAQETAIYTNELETYYHALELYRNKAYVAAQHAFNEIRNDFDEASEMRANCEYYAANCAVRLNQRNADELMRAFVDKYPNSTKRNDAFMEVAKYYYNTGRYSYALKWLKRVKYKNMGRSDFEDYLFKNGYSLFATKNYTKAKKYFVQLLDSPNYGAQAKYYYGYIAYQQDDYDNADKYLTEVSADKKYEKQVSYYMADMNFKLGKFQKAIDAALPLLATAKRVEKSEINKIIGESYFNLGQYEKAIPYLKEYKGKRNKWTNTDYYFLGYAYYKQGAYENAISRFNKIIDGNNAVAQNAYYHLAECYLKLDKKSEALNAFMNASQMQFKPNIQEDAYLNYAKLSYEIGNPYKSVPEVLQDFSDAYPNSPESTKINDLIISAYVVSKDYEGALKYLEDKKNMDKALYQNVAFLRGVQLYTEGKNEKAKTNFEKSLTQPIDDNLTARATYWKAESSYQLQQYEEALQAYQSFKSLPASSSLDENKAIDYQIGYVYFKQKEYPKAASSFSSYLNGQSLDPLKKNQAYLRLGDTYFVTSSYRNAINAYENSKKLNAKTADYAMFQTAISNGFLNNKTEKIRLLNKLIDSYSKSVYRDDALYVLGTTYTSSNKTTEALASYNQLVKEHPRSSFVPRVLLKKGLIYYNNGENEQALQVYKKAVSKYPNTAIAREAVRNARQIYIDTGRVDEYAAWVKNIDFINVTNAELDKDMYDSAEQQYVKNEYSKAISAFKKYLSSFPNGMNTLKAHFYLAQALESKNRVDETIPHYKYVAQQQQNEYTEQALSRLSQAYLNKKKWNEAMPLLIRLEALADHPQNLIYAQSNLMKAYYNKEDYNKAISYAEKVLGKSGIDNRVRSDARIIIARSAIKMNNLDKARTAYQRVAQIASGELKAEALYYSAFFKNKDGDYKNSNVIVQKLASDYAAYKYWGAKGLVVMAKNYDALKDPFQATYILERVIQNFTQFDDVVKEARQELNRIKSKEAKTNDSVLPE